MKQVLHLPCRAPRRSRRPRQLPPGLSQEALDALPEPRRQQVDLLLADRAQASSANPAAVSGLASAASTCSQERDCVLQVLIRQQDTPFVETPTRCTRPLTAGTIVAEITSAIVQP